MMSLPLIMGMGTADGGHVMGYITNDILVGGFKHFLFSIIYGDNPSH